MSERAVRSEWHRLLGAPRGGVCRESATGGVMKWGYYLLPATNPHVRARAQR